MNGKCFFGRLFLCLILAVFCGCTTTKEVEKRVEVPVIREVPDPRVPLTMAVLQRLSEDIKRYQLLLVGRITLETERKELNDRRSSGGKTTFEDVHIREVITIKDQTEGQVVGDGDTKITPGMVLSVCFDSNDTDTLNFRVMEMYPEGYFYLQYDWGTSNTGEEKGTVSYGGNTYKISFGGEKPPYLVIRLSQNDIDRVNARELRGRKVD